MCVCMASVWLLRSVSTVRLVHNDTLIAGNYFTALTGEQCQPIEMFVSAKGIYLIFKVKPILLPLPATITATIMNRVCVLLYLCVLAIFFAPCTVLSAWVGRSRTLSVRKLPHPRPLSQFHSSKPSGTRNSWVSFLFYCAVPH